MGISWIHPIHQPYFFAFLIFCPSPSPPQILASHMEKGENEKKKGMHMTRRPPINPLPIRLSPPNEQAEFYLVLSDHAPFPNIHKQAKQSYLQSPTVSAGSISQTPLPLIRGLASPSARNQIEQETTRIVHRVCRVPSEVLGPEWTVSADAIASASDGDVGCNVREFRADVHACLRGILDREGLCDSREREKVGLDVGLRKGVCFES